MKNFSDLLATSSKLDVSIVSQDGHEMISWPLLQPLDLAVTKAQSVQVDGMELISFGYWQDNQWILRHDRPFYQWRHKVTGQGWLLDPVKA